MADLNIDDVIAELTLEEKAALVMGSDFWHTAAVERLGVDRIRVSDGPHGLRMQPDEGDHVGIGGSLPATCFPTAAGLASSWDRGLFADVGSALAQEARVQGVSVILGPGINMKRSPLCGRNFEYLSEDPFLAGELALAMVAAIQEQGVGTSLKHFAANNQEDDRLRVSAEVDERTLREIYLPAFERVVTGAQPWTVMCAYNKVNGTYASEHHWLLTEVLRDEWGFEGLVVSDWGAVHDRVASLAAGLDLEMPPAKNRSELAVVDVGLLRLAPGRGARHRRTPRAAPGRAVSSHARGRTSRAGVRRPPRAGATRSDRVRRAAHERRRPPADPQPPRQKLAVIGPFATVPRYQGAGSSQVNPTTLDVPLEELRAALPARCGAGVLPRVRDRGRPQRRRPARPGPRARGGRGHRRAVPRVCPRRRSPRASTGPTSTCRPCSWSWSSRSPRSVTGWSSCSPTARSCAPRPGSTGWEPCSSAGSADRRPAAPSPTCSPARPTRAASSPRRSRCGSRTTPRS